MVLNSSGRAGCGADPERLRAEGTDRHAPPRPTSAPSRSPAASTDGARCTNGSVDSAWTKCWLRLAELADRGLCHLADAGRGLPSPRRARLARDGRLSDRGRPRRRRSHASTRRGPHAPAIATGGRGGVLRGRVRRRAAGDRRRRIHRSRSGSDAGRLGRRSVGRDPVGSRACGRCRPTPRATSPWPAWPWPPPVEGLPDDPDDGQWAHLLVEIARQAGHDRIDVTPRGAPTAMRSSAPTASAPDWTHVDPDPRRRPRHARRGSAARSTSAPPTGRAWGSPDPVELRRLRVDVWSCPAPGSSCRTGAAGF